MNRKFPIQTLLIINYSNVINGEKSSLSRMVSGVPQGSILGPTLFLIYVNDVVSSVKGSTIELFVNDMKICRNISSSEDVKILLQDVQCVFSWGKKWQLKFNANKCAVLHLGTTNSCKPYVLNGVSPNESNCECDLGVLI